MLSPGTVSSQLPRGIIHLLAGVICRFPANEINNLGIRSCRFYAEDYVLDWWLMGRFSVINEEPVLVFNVKLTRGSPCNLPLWETLSSAYFSMKQKKKYFRYYILFLEGGLCMKCLSTGKYLIRVFSKGVVLYVFLIRKPLYTTRATNWGALFW